MKRLFLMIIISGLLLGGNSFAQEKIETADKPAKKEYVKEKKEIKTEKIETVEAETPEVEKKGKSEKKVVVNTVCPVSGEEIENHDHTFEHDGKLYAVCCKKCMKKVKADPEKYTSRLSEDGKSLKRK